MPERKMPAPDSNASQQLVRLRAEIDELDAQIVHLLNKRARLGLEAGKTKALNGQAVADSEREREVLIRVAMTNEGPFPQEALLAIYRQLIETIKRLEELDCSGHHGDELKDRDD